MTDNELMTALHEADDDWQAELVALFGGHAAHFRYANAGRGDEGTALRAAYDRRAALMNEWIGRKAA